MQGYKQKELKTARLNLAINRKVSKQEEIEEINVCAGIDSFTLLAKFPLTRDAAS